MRWVLAVVVVLATACSSVAPGATDSPKPSSSTTPGPTQALTPGASASPTATAGPTATESPTATPSSTPSESGEDGELPPDGELTTPSGMVIGWLGSYCWMNACADAGMIPPKGDLPRVEVPRDTAEFVLRLSRGEGFIEWSAGYSKRSDARPTPLGGGGDSYDSETNATPPPQLLEARFPPPPSGDWVLHVRVGFLDGDASYAWHVVVP